MAYLCEEESVQASHPLVLERAAVWLLERQMG
jgi:hypothetical protein